MTPQLRRYGLIALIGLITGWLVVSKVQAQAGNGIVEPLPGETLSGVVVVRGTAEHPDYLRYELAFRRSGATGNEWIVFAEGSQPVIDSPLAVWDTTVGRDSGSALFPDGIYDLRLRVVRSDYNYDEYFLTGLILNNTNATPTAVAETPTPVIVTVSAETETDFGQIEALPSLTPFPTPTPQPDPPRVPLQGNDAGQSGGDPAGILAQLGSLESSRFVRAFGMGAMFVAMAFGLLAFYLLLRAIFRRLWRIWWKQ